jgi:hypothetical protein
MMNVNRRGMNGAVSSRTYSESPIGARNNV